MANVANDERVKVPNGIVIKSGDVSIPEISDEDLRKINKFSLKPLTKDQIFVFKIGACDNGLDDRNNEPFSLNALKDLKKLYVGKTVIKDHSRKADNQIARIFDAELIEDPTKRVGSDTLTTLQLKAYMLRTKSNEDLIAEIEAGIKKEVSTGCRPKHAYCSICGTDNTKTYCPHWGGREYDTKEGKKVCYFLLDGAKEAYEVSLVAVPAQPRAGTTKSYLEEDPTNKSEDTPTENIPENKPENTEKAEADAMARLESHSRYADAIFMNSTKSI